MYEAGLAKEHPAEEPDRKQHGGDDENQHSLFRVAMATRNGKSLSPITATRSAYNRHRALSERSAGSADRLRSSAADG